MTNFQPSGYERREGERRALLSQPMQDLPGWHLDKKVPLGIIFALLMQFGMAFLAYGDLKKDVELLKADQMVLHQRDTAQTDSLKEALRLMQDQFQRLDSKLDRLIERGQK
jgi:hypothetical protein